MRLVRRWMIIISGGFVTMIGLGLMPLSFADKLKEMLSTHPNMLKRI